MFVEQKANFGHSKYLELLDNCLQQKQQEKDQRNRQIIRHQQNQKSNHILFIFFKIIPGGELLSIYLFSLKNIPMNKNTSNQCLNSILTTKSFYLLINSLLPTVNNFIMLSQAGRQYERSKRVKPLEKAQRQRVYKSFSVKVDKPNPIKKFSPFNTISRESRNSYLLRVTNEPNVSTNYYPKFNQILMLERRSTIDKAKFERKIGDVKNDEEYSVDASTIEPKCLKSHSSTQHRPLTVRESQNWRKTFEHMNFKKQQDSKRLEMPSKQLSPQETTKVDFIKTLQTITESHFNNYKRFSFQSHPEKSHLFTSDSGHQYLKEVEDRDRLPEYDILATDESFMHRSMPKTKGEKRFFLYKDQIVTRHDRSDKNWNTFLEYDSKEKKKTTTIDFNQTLIRKDNDVHSKYPIRLSLSKPVRLEPGYLAA